MVERDTIKVHVMKLKNFTKDFRDSITSDESYEEQTSLENMESLRDELSYHVDALTDILRDIEGHITELEDEEDEDTGFEKTEENDGEIEEEPSILEQHYGDETKPEGDDTDGRTSAGSPDRKFDIE